MRYFKTLAVILTIAVLAGCSGLPAHNNTLIFAVKREVGVGVHTPGASTDPGIYLGYSSREIAWVPLWANGREGAMPCGTVNSTTATATYTTGTNVGGTSYQNSDCLKGPKFVGDGDSKRDPHDAYSTFASFGGNLNGSTDVATGQTKADAKLASFFATGIALRDKTISVDTPFVYR